MEKIAFRELWVVGVESILTQIRRSASILEWFFLSSILIATTLCSAEIPPASDQPRSALPTDGTWVMHNVEPLLSTKTLFGPVGGFLSDLDQDGLPDFMTIFEEGGVRIDFNPGPSKVSLPWPYIMIPPSTTDTDGEGLCAGDLDGDGNMDIVIAMGSNGGDEGDRRGGQGELEILWAPDKDKVRQAEAWRIGIIPSSVNAGNFNWVRVYDVNGDGRMDIVAGPNALLPGEGGKAGEYPYGGLQWYEAPKGDRRDLANWKRHQINRDFLGSSYGFQRADVNSDGFQDFIVIDADGRYGGTQVGAQKIVWYENPGDRTEMQTRPWPMHLIYQPEQDVFDVKPHIALGDLNGDGLPDLAVQDAQTDVLVFLNESKGEKWKLVKIPKPFMTCWKSRFTGIVDVDGDGHNDLLGALSRNDFHGGSIDTNKAAIFWMKCEGGNDVRSNNWVTFPIKRGSAPLPFSYGEKPGGEKWNRFFLQDLDADGDLDIIANCEEFVGRDHYAPLSVQWFEAPFANDKLPPSTPRDVKVQRFTDGVRILWSASVDNVGVAGYKVYRDHSFLGYVSNFNGDTLTYLDDYPHNLNGETMLDLGHAHYAVAAYDAAGNTSELSKEVTSQ